ncbi:unnamed protein product [Oppiella nova]|uniref:alpha-L-fucosidase n=1 Tax=Oppiella nova TaxID=334625 RepID=A0A7R9M576_9ACAR|nr:unnamed protein product [Oppiella nova]CAG2170874.1 unnamed protein product [Oppiella nova]
MRFGTYHSWMEWLNPLYLEDKANNWTTRNFVKTKSRPEREELITKYKPDLLWSDGEYESPEEYWESTDFLSWLYNDSPVKDTIVVNDRWGNVPNRTTNCKHGGYWNCWDKYNPKVLQTHKWENAMTIDRNAWTFRREAVLEDFLSPKEIMETLVQTVSCGGNLLINAGPTHDGRITPIFEERLKQMGLWLKRNGEAIYGSKPWTHQNDTITPDVWYTQNDGKVYASVVHWPESGRVLLGGLKYSTVASIQLIGAKDSLQFTEDKSGSTEVTFPALNPDTDIQWVYVLRISTK